MGELWDEAVKKLKEASDKNNIRDSDKEDLVKVAKERLENRKSKKRSFVKPDWISLLKEAEIPFFYDHNCFWWYWNEDKYKWEICDETDVLLEFMKVFTGTDLTVQKTKMQVLNALKLVGRMNKPKDTELNWIQFNNKVYNIQTGKIFEVTNEYFFTNPIKWKLGETEETPTIDKLFSEWVGDNLKPLLYEIIAYSLYRDYPIHRIFCFVGNGRNGKSKYLELVERFLGDDNTASSSLHNLTSQRFESIKLYKKLVCQMGESNYDAITNADMLKRLTGQDLISFEKKGKDGFNGRNYAKIMISTNGIPITHDKSEGYYRRWLIIDFPNKFPEGKDVLKSIPDVEYCNLALKCVRLLKLLLDRGTFTKEPSIEDKARIYEEKSNPLGKFLRENTEEGDVEDYVGKTDLYNKFLGWLDKNGFRSIAYKEYHKEMSQIYDSKQMGIDRERSWIRLKSITHDDNKSNPNTPNTLNTDSHSVPHIRKLNEISVQSVQSVQNDKKTVSFRAEPKKDDVIEIIRNYGTLTPIKLIVSELGDSATNIIETMLCEGELVSNYKGYVKLCEVDL